jgi:hypothetical protein
MVSLTVDFLVLRVESEADLALREWGVELLREAKYT